MKCEPATCLHKMKNSKHHAITLKLHIAMERRTKQTSLRKHAQITLNYSIHLYTNVDI